ITYVEQRIYAYQVGRYYNISCHIYFSDNTMGQWHEESYVYSEDGRLLDLEDIFTPGYDYLPIAKSTLENTIKETHDVIKAKLSEIAKSTLENTIKKYGIYT